MCYECQGIEQTISHYRQLMKLTTDHKTLDSIHILIGRLETDKKARHPDTAQAPSMPSTAHSFGRGVAETFARENE